jgi:hypothetical protein
MTAEALLPQPRSVGGVESFMNGIPDGNAAERGGPVFHSHAKRFLIIVAALLIAAVLGLLLQLTPAKSPAPTVLGGREYASTIAAPREIEFFQTTGFLAKLTNGPQPEDFAKVWPGMALDLAGRACTERCAGGPPHLRKL